MFLPFIPPLNARKPNRLDFTEKQKDKDYHLDWGRYILSAMNHPAHRQYMIKTLVNWNFYQNNQWIFDEDLEPFLKDESGDVRNRVRMVYNIIQPMVQQYVGNAIRMDFNAKVMSVSDFVVNRRETELDRLKYFTQMAENNPELQPIIKEHVPIGDNQEETEQIFENVYVDDMEKNMNRLLPYVAQVDNDFEQNKMMLAQHIALSGLAVHKGYEFSGKQIWEPVDSLYFLFDYGSRRKDLKDSEFMGEVHYRLPSDIYERWQDLTNDEREVFEKYSSSYGNTAYRMFDALFGSTRNRIPVFELYWKDIQLQEYGYVIDEFGYEMLTRINENGKDSKYTDKDLIIPKTESYVKFLGEGNKKRKMYVDILRYVVFSPQAIVGGNQGDIVMDFGIVPYQETYALDPSNVEFPYKCCCWDYHGGLILSPVDAIIDPQRLTNRMMSIAESHVNNARGTGTVIDKSSIDPQEGEEGILRNMNQSKPLIVDTRGRGVTNTVGTYGSNLNTGTELIFDIAERMRTVAQNISGVNEMMTGTLGAGQKLKSVAQMELQQGSLMQENFYYTLSNVLLQSYQSIAGVGKRIYCDSKRKLSMIMGDEGAQEILLTKDVNLEDFRAYVKRVIPDEQDKQMADQTLVQLRAAQIIEEHEFAQYYGRCTMEDVGRAIRDSFKRRQMARMAAEKERSKQQQIGVLQNKLTQETMDHQKEQAIALAQGENEKDRIHDLDKITLRNLGGLQKLKLKKELDGRT